MNYLRQYFIRNTITNEKAPLRKVVLYVFISLVKTHFDMPVKGKEK
jgi:hypothetical protein